MTEDEREHVSKHLSYEEDLFSSMRSKRSQGTGELDWYLLCISDKMDPLNPFPIFKKLSVKHTGLAAYAACRCLLQLCWTFVHCKGNQAENKTVSLSPNKYTVQYCILEFSYFTSWLSPRAHNIPALQLAWKTVRFSTCISIQLNSKCIYIAPVHTSSSKLHEHRKKET